LTLKNLLKENNFNS